jgi:hypothetical protein
MFTRRAVLDWIVSSALVAARGRSLADEGRRSGEVFDGSGGPTLAMARRAVVSVSNANDRYVGWVELSTPAAGPPVLSLDGGLLLAQSWGRSSLASGIDSATFSVDRRGADALAAVWNVVRQDRRRLDAGLDWWWRARRQPFRVGAPMEIVLGVENAGPEAVGFSIGGASRGSTRDNRFEFAVERLGRLLPRIQAHDFGGIGYYKPLKPGDTVELGADLTAWAQLDAAGSYHVRCSYRAELASGTTLFPSWPDHGHEKWDLTLTGAIDVVIA